MSASWGGIWFGHAAEILGDGGRSHGSIVTDLESEVVLISVCCLVPLLKGSTVRKKVRTKEEVT